MKPAPCPWVKTHCEKEYHDREWGRPEHDDRKLFEMLILEGMQAGLSWLTILKKREAMRKAFDGFDPVKISLYDEGKVDELLENADILRSRAKISALKVNAQAFLAVVKEFGTFDRYLWSFVNYEPLVNQREKMEDIPAETDQSRALSRDLKKRGFKFVGPVICYAYMQAVGMVNDHLVNCPQYNPEPAADQG